MAARIVAAVLQRSHFIDAPFLPQTKLIAKAPDAHTRERNTIERRKTHLLTGLCVAARGQKRVRFTTAAALVNELVEAEHQLQP